MSLAVTLILALITLILFLRWHIIERYSYFARRGIPHLPPKFPAGNFHGVTRQFSTVQWLRRHYLLIRGSHKLLGYYFGTAPYVLITDMDTAYDILVRDFNTFPSVHHQWNDPLAANLITMEGEQWRTIRTKLSPVFSAMSMGTVLSHMAQVNADLVTFVDQFADNPATPIDVRDLFMRYISDAISSSIFGMHTAALRQENHPLMNIAHRMFKAFGGNNGVLLMYFIISYSYIIRRLPVRIFPADISNYFIEIMDEAMRARVASNDAPRNDLLDLLVRIEQAGCLTDDETGEVLGTITHNQLLGHAFMTSLLGSITSRVALNFCLYELARRPEIQQRLREEVLRAIPVDQEVTYDALEGMPYLQQVVDETLRMYAPSAWIERRAKKDYQVRNSKYIIDKGTKIVIPVIGYHSDPNIYKDPELFDPDRMTKEKIQRRHPCAFMPFGIGHRGCMAQRVGYLYVKLAIVVLLRKFRFSVNEKTIEPVDSHPSAVDRIPATGLWLNVERCGSVEEEEPSE